MNKKIIIVAGYLASGKSTFAARLSGRINTPCFIKDTFKSAICANLPVTDREEGRRFSAATFNAIAYVAEKLMETGYPLIIEGNFVMGGYMKADESVVIKSLIGRYGYRSLTYIFWGDTRVLCDRFNEREKLPERGQANRAFAEFSYADFDKMLPPLGEFNAGGEIIKVETTDFEKVDYEGLFALAEGFIGTDG